MHITIPIPEPVPGEASPLFQRGVRLAKQLLRERSGGHFSAMDFRHALAITRDEGDALLAALQQQGLIARVPDLSIATYEAPRGR